MISPIANSSLVVPPPALTAPHDTKLRETFDEFVGQSFFGQMTSALRKTVGKPAYFHGGRAEEIFRGQLDQVLAQEISEASAAEISDPMYELFTLSR
jgi:hypothetical protein